MVTLDSTQLIRNALRLRCLQKPQSFRLIHLHHAATTKHITGNHRIREYEDFKYPDPKCFELELWEASPPKKKIDRIAFSTVLDQHLMPGYALLPLEPKIIAGLPEIDIPRYSVGELNTTKVYETSNKKSKGRGSKEFHFKTDVEKGHFAHCLYKAFHLLSRKVSPSPIEIHIHHPKKKTKALPGLSLQSVAQRTEALNEQKRIFNEAICNALHLWPETILRAMPEGTKISISPVANKEDVCWVMALDGRDKNKLFLKNREIHTTRFENCEGLLDKETRRYVKRDIRSFRLEVREELEAQEKEEKKKEKLKAKSSLMSDIKSFFSPAQDDASSDSETDILQSEESAGSEHIKPKISRAGKPNFRSLSAKIQFDDIIKSRDDPALLELRRLVKDKLSRKGTKGLLEQCNLEGLVEDDLQKVFFIALLQVKERVSVLDYERIHGTMRTQRENKMILERTSDLYKDQPNSKQLQEEIKRRLETDLNRVKRRNDDKISLELRKLKRQRVNLLDYLGSSERKSYIMLEGETREIMFSSIKKPKAGWTWQSRGSSKQLRS